MKLSVTYKRYPLCIYFLSLPKSIPVSSPVPEFQPIPSLVLNLTLTKNNKNCYINIPLRNSLNDKEK